MLIPAVQFEPTTVLDVQGLDMSSQFIRRCGADHFHVKYKCTHTHTHTHTRHGTASKPLTRPDLTRMLLTH